MLYDSIQKIKSLDKSLRLYPAHGSGSLCGKSIGAGNFCDLKTQSELNYAFLIENKEDFIENLTKDLAPPPKYFFFDANLNQEGIQNHYENILSQVKKPLNVDNFEKIVKEGVTVIDTRHILEDGLIKGAFWISSESSLCNLLPNVLEPEK